MRCGHSHAVTEQRRESRIRIIEYGIGKALHIDVVVLELGLGSAQMILPESPERRGDGSIYRKDF